MPKKTWLLTDTDHSNQRDEFRISAADMPSAGEDWSVTKRILCGGLQDGVELVVVDTGRMRVTILPTRGMGIWRAELASGERLGWKSPVHGPVHPKFVPLTEPSGLGWLDGFDELMVRCGLESNGAPGFDESGRLVYPLHGRIANRPAQEVEVAVDDTTGIITVRGVVEESRFHFQKLRLTASISVPIGGTSFTWNDRVENFGGTPAGMQMLYHINFGEPMLGNGAQLVAPVCKVTPRDSVASAGINSWETYGPPVAGAAEQCFFLELLSDDDGQTQVLLKNQDSSSGGAIRFNTNELPCFTQWKNEVASADGYVTGLEPATNLPNPREVEKQAGRVVELAAGESWSAGVTVDWLTTAEEVTASEEVVRALQSGEGM